MHLGVGHQRVFWYLKLFNLLCWENKNIENTQNAQQKLSSANINM